MSEPLTPLWIDTPDGVREAAKSCANAKRIALDTEADSMHSYFHKVCLIQISANGHHLVIDPLALEPEELRPLWDVVEDPQMPILMHGSDYDIRILDRDYGARVAGLQDTQIMAADWGRRPLKSAQLVYAASDTAHLGDLVDRLRARLEELDRWTWAEEEFRKLELVRHAPVDPDPLVFERIKGARGLRGDARDRIYSLHLWRERLARNRDIPPFKVLGNKALVSMAEQPPSTLDELGEIDGVGPRAVRRWGRKLIDVLNRPRRAPERKRKPRHPTPDAAQRRRLKNLMAARDAAAESLGIQAGLLCPKGVAEAVALRKPSCSSKNDLSDAGVVGWRLEILGDVFLEAVEHA
jgi:ribonuclease D